MTSAARKCVAPSISWNMSANFEMIPCGGPPSIISLSSGGIPMDISCARDGGLDKATYVASQRNSAEKKRGNFQWKMRPGSAVTPCRVLSVLAVLIVIGTCRLVIRRVNIAFEVGSCISTLKLRRESCGFTAIHPPRKSQLLQSRHAPLRE